VQPPATFRLNELSVQLLVERGGLQRLHGTGVGNDPDLSRDRVGADLAEAEGVLRHGGQDPGRATPIVWRLRPAGSDHLRRDRDLSDLAREDPDRAVVENVDVDDQGAGPQEHSVTVPLEHSSGNSFEVSAAASLTAANRESNLVER